MFQDSLVDLLLTLGAPSHKLVIGAPTNGYTYTLKNESMVKSGSPISGTGHAGDISNIAGILTQEEVKSHKMFDVVEKSNLMMIFFIHLKQICRNKKSGNWTVHREKDQTAPYMYNGDQWAGFEDEMSIKLKVTLEIYPFL